MSKLEACSSDPKHLSETKDYNDNDNAAPETMEVKQLNCPAIDAEMTKNLMFLQGM